MRNPPILIVPIAGSLSVRPRFGVLLERVRDWSSRHGVEVVSHQALDLPAEDLLRVRLDSSPVLTPAGQIGCADGLLVATLMYRASFSGALRVLLNLLPERTLEHKVVLSLVTGGSSVHMLVVDYALKPVLAALKVQEALHDVFAVDRQVAYATESNPVRLESVLEQCLESTLGIFHLAFSRRPQPIGPQLLNERLMNVRWSIQSVCCQCTHTVARLHNVYMTTSLFR